MAPILHEKGDIFSRYWCKSLIRSIYLNLSKQISKSAIFHEQNMFYLIVDQHFQSILNFTYFQAHFHYNRYFKTTKLIFTITAISDEDLTYF